MKVVYFLLTLTGVRFVTALLVFAAMFGMATPAFATTVRLRTSMGDIDIQLMDAAAPATVANFLNYVSSGVWVNSFIHRSVPGFIIQGGGYGWSAANQVYAVPANPPVVNEFSPSRSNLRGTIAMAKLSGDPNSATNQWFFNLANNSANLDGQNGGFTVFGQVIGNGMQVVDAIAALPRFNFNSPFDTLPLIGYNINDNVARENLVILNSLIVLPPVLSGISPASGFQGTSVPVTFTGSGFVTGMAVNAGSGIAVNGVNVLSDTSATAVLGIAGSAAAGLRNITVTAVGGTSNTVAFNVIANRPPVAVDDFYRVDKGGTLNVSAPGVLANDSDPEGDSMTAMLIAAPSHGVLAIQPDGSFLYVHDGSDEPSVSFTYKTVTALGNSSIATAVISIDGLFVSQFHATSTGFVVEFNHAIDATVLNLYDTETAGLGPADATLVGISGGNVRGSLVVSGNGGVVRFISTAGILPPDTYTATLRSAANGFKSLSVGLLDGDHDGIGGDNFSFAFTVANSPTVVVSVPAFARGPGQPVNLLNGIGIPLTLSDGIAVSQVDIVLKYDPTLLVPTGFQPGSGLPQGTSVQADFSVFDRVHITVNAALPLGTGSKELVRIFGLVAANAPYGTSQVLEFVSLSLNGGAIPALSADGLHVAAYIGDTTGNRSYSALDAQRILRVATGLDSGFSAFPRIDPIVVGDSTGNGLSSLDATRLLQEVVGIDRLEIPPLP